jgi:hypothetical protein
MAAFELPLVGLASALLTALALAGRAKEPPVWAGLLGPGAVAWVVGVQGLVFRRHPDYMVAYLLEVRQAAWLAYLVWAAAAIGLAWLFAIALRRAALVGTTRPLAVLVGALALGLSALPLFGRLSLIGSTIEFRAGIARPLSYQPAVGTLLALTCIGSFVPVAGAALLVAADGLRAAFAKRPGSG